MSLNLFTDDFSDDADYDSERDEEARALADEEADPFDAESDTDTVCSPVLPSAPRLHLVQRPAEPAFSTAPPYSALQSVGRLVGKLTSYIPPPPPLPDGTPFLRKPVTMTTESLKQIAAIKNDEGISFVLDVDLDEFDTIRKIIGGSALDAANPENGNEPAEEWRIDTLTVRGLASDARASIARISEAKKAAAQPSLWAGLRDWQASLSMVFDVSVQTVLWAEVQKLDNGQFSVSLRFQTKDGTTAKFALTYADVDYPAWGEVADALKARNERLIEKGFLRSSPIPADSSINAPRKRLVPRVNSRPFADVRIPTIAPVNHALTAVNSPKRWQANSARSLVYMDMSDGEGAQVAIECDEKVGYDSELVLQRVAEHGPALAQTFVAMVNLWMRENRGEKHEKYVTMRASDLLRAQGRSSHSGGFPLEEQREKAQQVHDLSKMSVPRYVERSYGPGRKITKTVGRLGSLVIVQWIDIDPEPENSDDMVTFRFHLNKDIHDAVCGVDGKYAELSSRLLTYHPSREKYQILIGLSLAYYDRVNRKNPRTHHPISLPSLLEMACIDEPNTTPSRFLERLETAINDLARDKVIPGLCLEKPQNWTELLKAKKGRDVLNGSTVVFPRMISVPEPAPTRIPLPKGAKRR